MRQSAMLLLAVLVGCSHSSQKAASTQPSQTPTCVVLSVGELKGVAQVGALLALHEAGVHIDCIAGNSMGSLIAGLYATAPDESLVARFRIFAEKYRSRTGDDVVGGGLIAALAVGLLTGGAALPMLGAGLMGADGTARIDRDRVVLVLDDMFHQASIERLPVPYVTFFQQRDSDGLKMVDARSGNLAQSIGRSIANPFIFKNLDVIAEGQMDPGGDRLAATPIEDTCRVFPDHRLIAINVTGTRAVHSSEMRCPVEEVMINVGDVDAEALFSGDGREMERVVSIGWRDTAPHFGLPAQRPAGVAGVAGVAGDGDQP